MFGKNYHETLFGDIVGIVIYLINYIKIASTYCPALLLTVAQVFLTP